MPHYFSTKAQTLDTLRGTLKSARIAAMYRFNVDKWTTERENCLQSILGLGSGPWIVRSSCRHEDGSKISNAGAFLSVLNVNHDDLPQAVDRVIESFGEVDLSDEVLVQPMLANVIRSGVAFSHDPNTCSPYRVINWSEGSNTIAVTGGEKGGQIWQQAAKTEVSVPIILEPIIDLLNEMLSLFDGVPLDIEFAVNIVANHEVLWLLQARPLILSSYPETEDQQANRLKSIHQKVVRGMQQHPFLMGRRNIYGVMPDWNPAEMIGIRPKPLALSLYRELITDSIWAYQRHNYGYRNLRSFPLMPNFFGLPYIDVRVSFNSYIL